MNMLGKTGFKVSTIGLGTVEIGLPYGIGVKNLPSDAEAETILRSAVDMGITYIDTARGYGVAEERIGTFGISAMPGVVVGTKCGQFLKQEPNLTGSELETRIRADIDTSRRFLKRDQLQLVQLHIELENYANLPELTDIMQKIKAEGKVEHIGIASRGEQVPLTAYTTDVFATSQLAYSILDQRMDKKVLPQAQKKNVGIINRSVLLKGALTLAFAKLPQQLLPLKTNAQKAQAIGQELGIDLPALAIRFVVSNPAISTILIGTINPDHLKSAIRAVNEGPLPPEIMAKLFALGLTDPSQADPANWPAT